MAVKEILIFRYKKTDSFLHHLPPILKLVFLLLGTTILFKAPSSVLIFVLSFFFLLSLMIHFPLKEQLSCWKPLTAYIFILYISDLLQMFFSRTGNFTFSLKDFTPQTQTIQLILFMFTSIQLASLVFRSTTTMEIRSALENLELKIRKIFHLKQKTTITGSFSLLILFIPMVLEVWNQIDRAWISRGGKNSFRKYLKLLPLLFSISMKKAYDTEKAIRARKN